MKDLSSLAKWIQPQHLAEENIKKYQENIKDELKWGVVLDNFLQPEIMEKLQAFAENEAEYEEVFRLRNVEEKVDLEAFNKADLDRRQHRFDDCIGVKPAFAMSTNWLTYLRFGNELCDKGLCDYLEVLTGYDVECRTRLLQSHRKGHFISKHNDIKKNRRLAALLYLSLEWKPEDGEAFIMVGENGEEKKVDSVYNRFLLFEPHLETTHYLDERSPLAGNKRRTRLVMFFLDKKR